MHPSSFDHVVVGSVQLVKYTMHLRKLSSQDCIVGSNMYVSILMSFFRYIYFCRDAFGYGRTVAFISLTTTTKPCRGLFLWLQD